MLENGQSLFSRQTLDLTHDLAHLLGGHPEIFSYGLDLHGVELFGLGLGGVGTVLLERAGEAEFTQLVTHHVFGDENSVENPAVVNVEGHPYELRSDRRATRPRLDWSPSLGILRFVDPSLQAGINIRTLFE